MTTKTGNTKVSEALRSRLEQRKPRDRVRAIVLLQRQSTGAGRARRLSREDRRRLTEEHRQAFAAWLPEIDRILSETGGRRLAEQPDSLGSLLVETSPEGVLALSASEAVKAILEDQPVKLVS
jgi:hypothetical protein